MVKPEWLYDSVKLGYCCDVDKYKVQGNEAGGPQTSTPNGNKDNSKLSAAERRSADENVADVRQKKLQAHVFLQLVCPHWETCQ